MGQLTGGVAHDFNNLLTPIIGSLDMLMRRGVGTERERRLIDGALQSAERAKTLVQRLLAFARRQPLQPTAVDLPELINGNGGPNRQHARAPGSRCEFCWTQTCPRPKRIRTQLEMAGAEPERKRSATTPCRTGASSLSRSGVRASAGATSRGSAPVTTCACPSGTPGTGMDEETRLRAIEPFFSTKGIGKGTGPGTFDGTRSRCPAWWWPQTPQRAGRGHDDRTVVAN